ncbi:MAG: xanthine dehydrogenase family protein molybdopterin-binding subunit [Aquabacterium sp.]
MTATDQAQHATAHGPRREDDRQLRGLGRFVGDLDLPGLRHAAFVRSPQAHARITSLDLSALAAQDGVEAVLGPDAFADLRQPQVNGLGETLALPRAALVDAAVARHLGQPLALVVAATAAQARAAVESAYVETEELAPVADHDATAPALYPGMADNRVALLRHDHGALPDRTADARLQLACPRVAAQPMEPRAALVRWDAAGGLLTAWLSTQTPARARDELAAALGLAADQVRVIAPDVGGSFGCKASLYPEDLMLARAARLLGGAIRWQATRMEDLLSASHGRASRLGGSIWLQADNAAPAIAGLQADLHFALGAWLPYSGIVPARNAARILPGPYRCEAQQVRAQARLSTAAPVGIYRGAGRPEASLLMERLVDEAAAARGQDPLALRRALAWAPHELPRTLAHGVWLDRADLPGLLDTAATRFGYAQRRARQAEARAAGRCVGIGMALYVEPCGQGAESVVLTARADGRYRLATGSTAQGQGRETAYAAIAAPVLGCEPQAIDVLHGDTGRCPPGIGALASRGTPIGGSAVLLAARALRERLDGGAARPCEVALNPAVEHEAWASGCVMVQVEIDRATGALAVQALCWVDDAGTVVHDDLLHGQLHGGLAQGLGATLLEHIAYDDAGQLLSGSLLDYALPRADDMPDAIDLISRPTPSAANALGAKGVGEAGCIGVPAALMNAAADALRPLGARLPDMPLTPCRLWQALQTATH